MVGKRQRSGKDDGVSCFLDMEAIVSDGESEYGEEDEEDLDPFIIDDEADDDIRPFEYWERYRDDPQSNSRVEQLVAEWRSRQENPRIARCLDAGSEESDEGPGESAWTYWIVPVRTGGEKKTAELLTKSLPMGMRAFAAPWTKGRVYTVCPPGIDAPLLIRYYTTSLSQVYAHRHITRVSELDRRFLVQHLDQSVRFDKSYPVGSWIQIRHGLYCGDVARVYRNSSDSDEIYLQVVPRIPDKPKRTSEEVTSSKLCDRPPRHLFHAERVIGFRLTPGAEDNQVGPIADTYCLWSKVFFRNGLLLLRVQGTHYIKHYRPSLQEIFPFTIARVDTLLETNRELLQVGDRIREVKGRAMSGIDGIVISKSEEAARVKYLADEDGEEKVFILGLGDVQRVFAEGDAIEVCVGELRGRRGLVLDVPDTRELSFLDISTKQQMCVFQAFVQTSKLEERMRNIPTLASMQLTCKEESRTRHPCMYKTVYIIPEKRFARIVGIHDAGTHFYVEAKSEDHGCLFAGQHLLETETWLTLDHRAYDDCEDAKQLFKSYVEPGEVLEVDSPNDTDETNVELAKSRFIDFLPTSSHIVFVTDKNYKRFGYFVGTNGKGDGIIKFEDRHVNVIISATSAISMILFRRLDGTRPGRLRIIRMLFEKHFKIPQKKRKKARLALTTAESKTNMSTTPKSNSIASHIPEDQLSCAFVFSDAFRQATSVYCASFKFRIGCITPRNVDGKSAWTMKDSVARRSTQDIRLTYKTHDGGRPRDEYIPLSSIEPTPPSSHPEDRALVIKGEHFGKVVYPKRFARNENKQRVGTYCTLAEKDRKKDAILFHIDSLICLKLNTVSPPL